MAGNRLVIKIYVMENIYHCEITAISEETRAETVTNAGRGLNVPQFDLKGRSMKQLVAEVGRLVGRGAAPGPSPNKQLLLSTRGPLIFNTYISDK